MGIFSKKSDMSQTENKLVVEWTVFQKKLGGNATANAVGIKHFEIHTDKASLALLLAGMAKNDPKIAEALRHAVKEIDNALVVDKDNVDEKLGEMLKDILKTSKSGK
ncbi:MAG: hypothetical protein IFNCLDLE_02695 [Ignavibacteriaceae bacterium]|nr:hypothetical protein [Ignavibacteriaceae bacterium]